MGKKSDNELKSLGVDKEITRRDFVKGTLVGTGAALLTMPAPLFAEAKNTGVTSIGKLQSAWTGYGGVGDYSEANGNTEAVINAAHTIRDKKFEGNSGHEVIDTGEVFDLIICGGGFAGLSAARTFRREHKSGQKCLLLDNNHMTGGEAKRNEFIVNGHRLIGPQGSNLAMRPSKDYSFQGGWYNNIWDELKLPRDPSFQKYTGNRRNLKFAKDNYLSMFPFSAYQIDSGYFFDKKTFGGKSYWDINSATNDYKNTPFSEHVRADLNRLHEGMGVNKAGKGWEKWLDSITHKEYLENVLGVDPGVTKLFSEPLATGGGLGSDVVSALAAMKLAQPGFEGFSEEANFRSESDSIWEEFGLFSFPGGNEGIARVFLKQALPEAVTGSGDTYEAIHDGRIDFDALDRNGSPVRIRPGSTVISVAHEGKSSSSEYVVVTYLRDGKLHRARARGVVSAMGGWVNKHVIKNMPAEYAEAFGDLVYGSAMSVNIALTNWRFMDKLGITAAHYFDDSGVGFHCNIKQPMVVGDYQPPLDPDKPALLTFYVGFINPGLSAREQGIKGRLDLLSTSYVDYEIKFRRLLTDMFGGVGFDPKKDIAGMITNRWGHSYVVPQPGFWHGKDGRPSLREVASKPFGRITFGHSELEGIQEWFKAAFHGERAARQVLEML